MQHLTEAQAGTLAFINKFSVQNGVAPCMSEITRAMGWKSRAQAYKHVRALSDKGAITLGGARGCKISSASSVAAIPSPSDSEYWYEGNFKASLYQMDLIEALAAAGVTADFVGVEK